MSNEEKITNFLSDPLSYSPLVIIGNSQPERSRVLEEICRSKGWEVTDSYEIMEYILKNMAHNRSTWNNWITYCEPALIVDNLDVFKNRPTFESELERLILKCRTPVVLSMDSYEGLSFGLRSIVAEAVVIHL